MNIFVRTVVARTVSRTIKFWFLMTLGSIGVATAADPQPDARKVNIHPCKSSDGLFTLYTPSSNGIYVNDSDVAIMRLQIDPELSLAVNNSRKRVDERLVKISVTELFEKVKHDQLRETYAQIFENAHDLDTTLHQKLENKLSSNLRRVDSEWCQKAIPIVRNYYVELLKKRYYSIRSQCEKTMSQLDTLITLLPEAPHGFQDDKPHVAALINKIKEASNECDNSTYPSKKYTDRTVMKHIKQVQEYSELSDLHKEMTKVRTNEARHEAKKAAAAK